MNNDKNKWDDLFSKAMKLRKPSLAPPDFEQIMLMVSGIKPIPKQLDNGTKELISFLSNLDQQTTQTLTHQITDFIALVIEPVFKPLVSTIHFSKFEPITRNSSQQSIYSAKSSQNTLLKLEKNLKNELIIYLESKKAIHRLNIYKNGDLTESLSRLDIENGIRFTPSGFFRMEIQYKDATSENIALTI